MGALMLVGASVASAAGTVSKLVFSPSPIGTVATVSRSTSVAITLTAEHGTGTPVPGGTVYISFAQASGGGTAFVGTIALVSKPAAFTADGSGHIAITYTTPPSFPNTGCDAVKAQNGPTRFTSTVAKFDAFCFSPIIAIGFTPKPIARQGSLGTSSHVTVTLTVFGAGGVRLANGTVWVNFKPTSTTSGANATVNGVALTATPTAKTTNSIGQVFIVYSTGTVLPTSGSDRFFARNDPKLATITTSDAYQY